MFLRWRGEADVGSVVVAVCVTDRRAPSPTVIEVGKLIGLEFGKLPGMLDMCEEAPVSMYPSLELGGIGVYAPAEERAEKRAVWSHAEEEDDPVGPTGLN
jgi:hypothetical protein